MIEFVLILRSATLLCFRRASAQKFTIVAPLVLSCIGVLLLCHIHFLKKVDHDVMMRDYVPEAVFAAHKVGEAQFLMLYKSVVCLYSTCLL